jgi:hypothetical protein
MTMPSDARPTIVLVRGAFADASGWAEVITSLTGAGYTCYAPANPLRGIAADGDYIRSFPTTIPGPVVLAGHSYGGRGRFLGSPASPSTHTGRTSPTPARIHGYLDWEQAWLAMQENRFPAAALGARKHHRAAVLEQHPIT